MSEIEWSPSKFYIENSIFDIFCPKVFHWSLVHATKIKN